jgi:hypothetical protein
MQREGEERLNRRDFNSPWKNRRMNNGYGLFKKKKRRGENYNRWGLLVSLSSSMHRSWKVYFTTGAQREKIVWKEEEGTAHPSVDGAAVLLVPIWIRCLRRKRS